MGSFFQRLNIYTEVVPNQGMVDTITKIIAEVLNLIRITTREIKECRISKHFITFSYK